MWLQVLSDRNDDYYCARCGISDSSQQIAKLIAEDVPYKDNITTDEIEFNCNICKFKTILGIVKD